MKLFEKAMTKKYIQLSNLLDSKLDELKNDELGAINMIEIIIIIVVLLAVMVVFRQGLMDLVTTAFEKIKEALGWN